MHELSVTENLLALALRHAQQANASKITELHLVIGQLASIVDDSVQFYWDFVAKGTIAEGAVLYFERIPARIECLACQRQYTTDGYDLACPYCGSSRARILSGEEFFLDSITVEN